MNENQKLVQDFGRAIANYMLARTRQIDTSKELGEVNRIEAEILSRMKTREPL